MAGEISESKVEESLKSSSGWVNVNELGLLDRKSVKSVMSESLAGIVTFHPHLNHIESQPNKMFEYMSAGLPVIASNFPLWKSIIEGNKCGICVDPKKPDQIANAIDFLFENPKIAISMGENGKKSIMKKYNWSIEEKKLIKLYEKLLT